MTPYLTSGGREEGRKAKGMISSSWRQVYLRRVKIVTV